MGVREMYRGLHQDHQDQHRSQNGAWDPVPQQRRDLTEHQRKQADQFQKLFSERPQKPNGQY